MNALQIADPMRFRSWIARRLGLNFDDGKLGFLAELLARRAQDAGRDPHGYLDRLEAAGPDPELRALIAELTVPETYFFRHMEQFRAFSEIALADAARRAHGGGGIQVLSAGCASGEEPYSLAMCAQELGSDFARGVSIAAADINPNMLDKARRGVYSAWSLRETPPEVHRRWFRASGRELEVDPVIRAAVSFHEANLADEQADLWTARGYDVIFCRNLLMYFTPEAAQGLVGRFTRALAPGGHLFLGHAETLRGLSSGYHLCHTHGTFYYQRKTAAEAAAQPSDPPRRRSAAGWGEGLGRSAAGPGEDLERIAAVPAADRQAWTTTWLETVQQSSERIRALSQRPAAEPAVRAVRKAEPRRSAATQVQSALELLRGERFSEALGVLAGLPQESENDPDVLLLRAALLTHSGHLAAAEKASRALLERDELNAGAHYLLALCRESAGDRQGALDHDQTAAYLDPAFAMPRLHLGLMADRGGDGEGARRELAAALVLLKREDASRLLLFGGGFGREALIALCSARLAAEGGMP
ncbi:MAG TPA: CheR family methyltransferase [Steroidobacteraceae bacterium]|nr:CheR family methyltransferase [Steroidobacteraceae bacterium]